MKILRKMIYRHFFQENHKCAIKITFDLTFLQLESLYRFIKLLQKIIIPIDHLIKNRIDKSISDSHRLLISLGTSCDNYEMFISVSLSKLEKAFLFGWRALYPLLCTDSPLALDLNENRWLVGYFRLFIVATGCPSP